MKAAVLWERRTPLSIEEVELADPQPGEARVRILASGVCHSDLHHINRDSTRSTLPLVLGHEAAGSRSGTARCARRRSTRRSARRRR